MQHINNIRLFVVYLRFRLHRASFCLFVWLIDFSISGNPTQYICSKFSLIQILIIFALEYYMLLPLGLPTPNCTEWCVALHGQRIMSIHSILQNNVPSTCLYCLSYPFFPPKHTQQTHFFAWWYLLQPHHCLYTLPSSCDKLSFLHPPNFCLLYTYSSPNSNAAPFL